MTPGLSVAKLRTRSRWLLGLALVFHASPRKSIAKYAIRAKLLFLTCTSCKRGEKMPFAEKIKPLWEATSLTLEDIAKECNISASMVSRYINGKVVPQADIAEKMLLLLGGEVPAAIKNGEDGETMQTALNMIRDVYEGRLEDMRAEIKDLKERVIHEKREKWIFTCLLMVVITFVFLFLYLDITNGTVGWFRH